MFAAKVIEYVVPGLKLLITYACGVPELVRTVTPLLYAVYDVIVPVGAVKLIVILSLVDETNVNPVG